MAQADASQSKKRKRVREVRKTLNDTSVIVPSLRATHSQSYHSPLLLSRPEAAGSLLEWYGSVSESRSMPWRRPWLDPKGFRGSRKQVQAALAIRAYEVWVSEIMLQQTRVSVVIPYFNRWVEKWPSVQALAGAEPDEVLSAWKGLGYYSRATRLHEAAKLLVHDERFAGTIPESAQELQMLPGVGRYTAGAISSIAFGRATPLLDGNVSRVLCRQLGIHADLKRKQVSDLLWQAADALVRHAAKTHSDEERSQIPGSWNQALMELGSTICTPRPKCEMCPIQSTCRAFIEGESLLAGSQRSDPLDIEDLCTLCEPFEEVEQESERGDILPTTVAKTSPYFRPGSSPLDRGQRLTQEPKSDAKSITASSSRQDPATLLAIKSHCSNFPKKSVKAKVREEECVVCVIGRREGPNQHWLIEKRPAKGLLASLWQFPLLTLDATNDSTKASRKREALKFVSSQRWGHEGARSIQHVNEMGPLTHIFSHLKLKMFIHVFTFNVSEKKVGSRSNDPLDGSKWVEEPLIGEENLWTGMRRCWDLVRGLS